MDSGHLRHLPSGLALTLYRAYDPGQARWLSRDPLLLGGGSFNFYAYVSNDPINFIDPLGTQEEPGKSAPEKYRDEVVEALLLHIAEHYAEKHHVPFPCRYVTALHTSKAAELSADFIAAMLSAAGIDLESIQGKVKGVDLTGPNSKGNPQPDALTWYINLIRSWFK